ARKMTAAANGSDGARKRMGFVFPGMNANVWTHHPFRIVAVQVHGSVCECTAPLNHGCVVVRMGDADSGDAAKRPDVVDRRVVEQADAIPEDVSDTRLDKERALAYRKARLDCE